jgi:hypothetical protein
MNIFSTADVDQILKGLREPTWVIKTIHPKKLKNDKDGKVNVRVLESLEDEDYDL